MQLPISPAKHLPKNTAAKSSGISFAEQQAGLQKVRSLEAKDAALKLFAPLLGMVSNWWPKTFLPDSGIVHARTNRILGNFYHKSLNGHFPSLRKQKTTGNISAHFKLDQA